jgi:hypothetical protein
MRRGILRKAIGRAVPLSRDVVTVSWASESLAEALVRYVESWMRSTKTRTRALANRIEICPTCPANGKTRPQRDHGAGSKP